MNEAEITTELGKIRHMMPLGGIEVKVMKGTSIAFDRVAPHQVAALRQITSTQGLYYKIPDAMHGTGVRRPFDIIHVSEFAGWVLIVYYVPRAPRRMFFFSVEKWVDLAESSTRKSANVKMLEDNCSFQSEYTAKNFLTHTDFTTGD